ncbi:MAG: ribosome-binding factor A [Deltaproteobacteria bacterium]|nr:ribosome-binding factor A [Deltaproteobacteria bacterium]
MAVYRKERVGELILSCLANEIRLIEDERLVLMTLTAIEMSKDLKHATLYWIKPVRGHFDNGDSNRGKCECSIESIDLPHKEDVRLIEDALLEYKKHLKRSLSEQLNLRYTPELHFKYDYSVEQGARIDNILQKLP